MILENQQPLPEVHQNAGSISSGRDRNPVSVAWCEGNSIWVRDDQWKVVEGGEHDGSAKYEYYRGDESDGCYLRRFRLNKKKNIWEGVYKVDGGSWRKDGSKLYLGRRARYYDPHF